LSIRLRFINSFFPNYFMGSDLKVGDIMRKNVITVNEKENIVSISKLMKKNTVGSIVVTEGKKATGIITERDIVYKVNAEGKETSRVMAKEIMSSPIIVITPEATLEEAAKAMKKHSIKRLPVINKNKELVGIVSERDIMEIFPAVIDLIEEKASL